MIRPIFFLYPNIYKVCITVVLHNKMEKKKYRVWIGRKNFIVYAKDTLEIHIKYPEADQIDLLKN